MSRPWSPYGRSPAVDALKDIKELNELPPEIRAAAAAAFVGGRAAQKGGEFTLVQIDALVAYMEAVTGLVLHLDGPGLPPIRRQKIEAVTTAAYALSAALEDDGPQQPQG